MAKAFAERPRWQKWGIVGGWVFVSLMLIVAFMGREPEPDFIAMSTPDHFAAIIPADAGAANVEAAAREKCGARQYCKVLGWTDRSLAARAMPMLERETAALVFAYTLNRAAGMEQALWDCRTWPQSDPARCLAK